MSKTKTTAKEMTISEIKEALGYDIVIVTEHSKVKLADKNRGDTFVGPDGREWVIIKKEDDRVYAVTKDFVFENTVFDPDSNDFRSSQLLEKFKDELLTEIGEESLHEFTVDLTTLDGLKDYGTLDTKISLLTYQLYLENQDILAPIFKDDDDWQWLANALSTPQREVPYSVLCVAPQGYVGYAAATPTTVLVRFASLTLTSLYHKKEYINGARF